MTTVEQLHDYLAERLPGYMLPSAIVELEALPLTPNRKVDMAALPPPTDGPTSPGAPPPARPADPVERAVAQIWREVLGCHEVGVHDNFFRVGGNSLGVMIILGRLRSTLGVRVTAQDFFGSPTVRSLADCIRDEVHA